MNINLIYDSSVNNAPAAFKTALNAVVQFLDTTFINAITINISVGYGTIAGQSMSAGTLGESETYFQSESYSQIRTALTQNANSADQLSAVNSLPAADPTAGGNYWVATAEAKALGLSGASSALDGYVGFASSYPFTYNNSNGVASGTYDFYGVAVHELTEVMGRSLFVGTDGIGANAYTPLDLFHYSANGVRDFVGTTVGYFSIDGGNTKLNSFNTNSGGDFGDWASSAGNDAFLAFSNSGVVNAVSQADLREMNILGYDEGPPPDTTVPALVADNALGVGVGKTATISTSSLAFSDPDNTDAQLTYTVVTPAADGTLLKNGAATSTFTQADVDNGLVSYAENGTSVSSDSFTFYVSDPAGNRTGTQTFQLLMPGAIEKAGSTWLTEVGNEFYLDSGSTGTGPLFKYNGAPVVVGEFGNWVLLGAEQTATGYDVAWKIANVDQYSVSSVDSNGNLVTNFINNVKGNDASLEAIETSLQQDLNGDGVIGPPGTVIEKAGSTWLTQVGSEFYLDSSSTGTGPLFKYNGAPVVVGEFGNWVLLGAEQTGTGYDVAWKIANVDQYSVSSVDSSGNLITNFINNVKGNDPSLEAVEPTFQQDLNRDGVIGVPGQGTPAAMVIENAGSIWLTEVGNEFYLDNSATGTGPVLQYNGAPVTAGEFGAWVPLGAEQTATGYEVAWKIANFDQYTVWNTDSNGNWLSNPINNVTGNSVALETVEPSFQQDLNGDGVIGVPATSAALLYGSSTAASPAEAPPGAVVGSGDFNGDGNADILWLNANNAPTIWEMNGASIVNTVSLPAAPSSWHLAGTGDFNGDSKADILWHTDDGMQTVWELNGTQVTSTTISAGSAAPQTISTTPSTPVLSAADLYYAGRSPTSFGSPVSTIVGDTDLIRSPTLSNGSPIGGALART